ncbi:unnamed protein product [Thlaspi arvense]|uniref:RRM domain-containing protein n=1 Tax=Thlaspi arvense TaxID=13288 RepID=A0AAU9R9H5_THLAR|nr:unnamed protein product [Thlaspi arvense]CAH2033884.1 unnamed protein product [Thlaspi arvense]
MDESANKGMKRKRISKERGMKLKGCDAAIQNPKARDIGRISVTGFDSGLPHEDVESALRKHFASCGNITDVYIGKHECAAFVYLVGEDAVDKALKLSGRDVGGWNVCVEAYPFSDHMTTTMIVQGYDISDTEIQVAARELFSSCVEVAEVFVIKKGCSAVRVKGFDAIEKVRVLDGSYIGDRKVSVRPITTPPRHTVHDRRRRVGRPGPSSP